jgi:hypothetical protein
VTSGRRYLVGVVGNIQEMKLVPLPSVLLEKSVTIFVETFSKIANHKTILLYSS